MVKRHHLSRRTFLATGAAAATAYALPVQAQNDRFAGRQVVMHTFTSARDLLQSEVGTWLTETTGGELSLVPMPQTAAYARMQAELADPQIDLFVSISENELDAKEKGISHKIDFMENALELPPARRDEDGYWVHWAFIGEGLLYRTDKIESPPESYADLFKPEYAGHVMFPTITNAYGFDFLVMMARLGGGGEHDIEPGFDALKRLKDAGATIIRGTPPEIQQQFAQNDMWILPYDTGNAHMAQQVGLPIGFTVPKEGAPAVFCSVFMTANTENAEMGSVVIDRLLSPAVQGQIASQLGWGPVHPDTDLEGVGVVFPTPDQIVELDRETMRANRSEWTERFQKEIAS